MFTFGLPRSYESVVRVLLDIINMLIIICCSYDFYSTFHVFDGAAYP